MTTARRTADSEDGVGLPDPHPPEGESESGRPKTIPSPGHGRTLAQSRDSTTGPEGPALSSQARTQIQHPGCADPKEGAGVEGLQRIGSPLDTTAWVASARIAAGEADQEPRFTSKRRLRTAGLGSEGRPPTDCYRPQASSPRSDIHRLKNPKALLGHGRRPAVKLQGASSDQQWRLLGDRGCGVSTPGFSSASCRRPAPKD